MQEGFLTESELRKSIARLASGKAIQAGGVPIECFKAIARAGRNVFLDFLDICNGAWSGEELPESWLSARVAMIFKKGDPAMSTNYRPICLTAAAYRIYASMIKQRLLDAGLDSRLWPSQFGFCSGRSTEDALYLTRRHVEQACAWRTGRVSLLALDWAKCFDSVHVGRLMQCLRRFGVRGAPLKSIAAIMQGRTFFVEDSGVSSSRRLQLSGISQGCTLSPLLFVTLMSAVMHDAVTMLPPSARDAYSKGQLADVVYADAPPVAWHRRMPCA